MLRVLSVLLIAGLHLLHGNSVFGATLSGSFSPIAQGSNVNLTVEGKLDWVHWGLQTDSSLNRKATVTPQIRDFTIVYNTNITWSAAYQFADNYGGYTWHDGTQVFAVTNTTTGIYAVGGFNPTDTNGVVFTVPADTTVKTLKVYVGTYAARGRFVATLSDHPTSYIDTSLSNFSNGPGGVYTVNFAANSANQTLTIRWAVAMKNQPDGNVTLQAATLSSVGANNPPYAQLTSPSQNASFATPADISMTVEAWDFDGSISKVEFYNIGTKLGESFTSPYSFTFNGATPGIYRLTARPVDNNGAVSLSTPIDVFVHGSGGTLNGAVTLAPSNVNLSNEGTVDWVHWGLTNAASVNRKANVSFQIGNLSLIGTNVVQTTGDSETKVTWTDGTPVGSVVDSQRAIYISGIINGFRFSVRASTNLQTLKVYAGLYGAAANFQAWLTDFSAPVYADRSLTNAWGNAYAVYTINFAASTPVQFLTVRYTADYLFDQDYGNVALQAVTLNGPAPVYLFNAASSSGEFTFSFFAHSGVAYTIYYTDSISSPQWQVLSTVSGAGADALVTDTNSHAQRFYRVETH